MAKKAAKPASPDAVAQALHTLATSPNQMTNAAEAAKQLEISLQRVSVLCQEGRIAGALKIGRSWVIPQKSVDDFAEIERVNGRNIGRRVATSSPPKKPTKKKPKK